MMFGRQRELVCQQAVELVTDYIEGSMSRADRRRFEAHLSSCPHCTAYLAQMRTTIQLTGQLRSEELPSEVREELVSLYSQWRSASGWRGLFFADVWLPGNDRSASRLVGLDEDEGIGAMTETVTN
jgi:hypothetical protein